MPRNGGFAYGNNAAIARARQLDPDLAAVVLLNPDAVVRPGGLVKLMEQLRLATARWNRRRCDRRTRRRTRGVRARDAIPARRARSLGRICASHPAAVAPCRLAAAVGRLARMRLGVGRLHGDPARSARCDRAVRRRLLPLLRGGRLLPSRAPGGLVVLARCRRACHASRGRRHRHQGGGAASAGLLVRVAAALLRKGLRDRRPGARRPALGARPDEPRRAPCARASADAATRRTSRAGWRAIFCSAMRAPRWTESSCGSRASVDAMASASTMQRASGHRRHRPQRGRAPAGVPRLGPIARLPGRLRRLWVHRRQPRARRCAVRPRAGARPGATVLGRPRAQRRASRPARGATRTAIDPVPRWRLHACCPAGSKPPNEAMVADAARAIVIGRFASGTPKPPTTTACAPSNGARRPAT